MKKLDSKGLFDIFSQGDEAIYEQHGIHDAIEDSFILFGMVIRGVENYYIIDRIYTYKMGKDYDSVRDSIKMKYFNGLVYYLERIDVLQSDTVIHLIDEFGLQPIKYALEELLQFYEEKEMYEKCAIIFKFFDIFFKK
jgi:hypothetical protein